MPCRYTLTHSPPECASPHGATTCMRRAHNAGTHALHTSTPVRTHAPGCAAPLAFPDACVQAFVA
eukprot:648647-Alexandrium_andersonii.AAC.1